MQEIEPLKENVTKLQEDIIVDSILSSSSTHPVENRVITIALANKVSKEKGKGLSTNDFTDYYVNRINNSFGVSHSHNNKEVLDGITSSDIDNWNAKGNLSHDIVYENSAGQTGNIPFLESISNADFIDIVFSNNSSIYDVKRVYNPVGKIISLTLGSCNATSFEHRTQTYTVGSDSMVAGTCHKYALNSAGALTVTNNASIEDSDKLKVHKVIAYKL